MTDHSLESNPRKIGERAMAVVTDVREVDPRLTFDTLAMMCADEPERMAQVIMCLAAWVNTDETVGALGDRAVAITQARCAA